MADVLGERALGFSHYQENQKYGYYRHRGHPTLSPRQQPPC